MGFDRTGLTTSAEKNTDGIGAEGPGKDVGATALRCKHFAALVRRSSGNAVSRAEEGQVDGKDSAETVLASRESC
jgi:hypothetical protein